MNGSRCKGSELSHIMFSHSHSCVLIHIGQGNEAMDMSWGAVQCMGQPNRRGGLPPTCARLAGRERCSRRPLWLKPQSWWRSSYMAATEPKLASIQRCIAT